MRKKFAVCFRTTTAMRNICRRSHSRAKGIGKLSTEKGKGSMKVLHPGVYEPSGRVKGWRVEFRLRSPDQAKMWLGTFKSKEKAMRAYDASQYFLGRSPHYYDHPEGFFCEAPQLHLKGDRLKQHLKEMAFKYAESTEKLVFRSSFGGSGFGIYQEDEQKQEGCQEDAAMEPSEVELGVIDYEVAGAVDAVFVPFEAPSPSTSQHRDFGEVESQHKDQPSDVEMGMDAFSSLPYFLDESYFDSCQSGYPCIPHSKTNRFDFFEPIQGLWGPDLHPGHKCDSTCEFAFHDSGKVHLDMTSNNFSFRSSTQPLVWLAERDPAQDKCYNPV